MPTDGFYQHATRTDLIPGTTITTRRVSVPVTEPTWDGYAEDHHRTRPVLWALILPGDPVLADDYDEAFTVDGVDATGVTLRTADGVNWGYAEPISCLILDLDRIHENPTRCQHPDLTP